MTSWMTLSTARDFLQRDFYKKPENCLVTSLFQINYLFVVILCVFLGRIVSIHPSEGHVWELYAKLAPTATLKVQRYQKAYHAYTKNSQWVKDLKICNQILYICFELSDLWLTPEIACNIIVLHSIKLNLTSAISAIRQQGLPDTRESIDRLVELLDAIAKKINSANPNNK